MATQAKIIATFGGFTIEGCGVGMKKSAAFFLACLHRMSTINSIPFRSTIFYRNDGTVAPLGTVLTIGINNTMSTTNSLSIDTLTASTITVSKLNLASTVISLGQSTNQTYNNFSNGSYLTWVTAKSALSGTNKTVMSANGLYQMIVGNTTSGLFLSSDSGITWTSLTGGLPVLTGSAYWSDGTISANGQYITLSIYGGSLWMSADYGRTFALTNQPTPSIWLPLNGSVADSMGLSVVTTPGTVPGYVTLNYPGYTAQAVNLLNTAGGTATRYITGTWTGSPSGNFTVSGWFNPQSLTGVYQVIFSTYSNYCAILINPSNQLIAIVPSGGGLNYVNVGVSSTLVINTWYYFSLSFQTNGTCSFYLNNTLLGSITNTQGVASLTTSVFELSGYEGSQAVAFNGFMDDFRITNSVSTYVPIPLLQPNIWLPFENTAGDLGSNAITPTVVGSLSYVPGVVGLNAVNLVNPPGGTPANYIYGSWPALTVCTISGWFNIQSFSTTANQFICSLAAATGSIIVFIDFTSRKLSTQLGISQASIGNALSLNTWYYFQLIVPSSSSATLYLNSDSVTFAYTAGTSAGGGFSVGTYSGGGYAFNGYVDDLRIYNADVGYHTLLPQNYRALALSGTGQYALAAAASGWVVGSSDLLKTWSKRAVCVGTQGDIIQPNKTGLVQSTWEQNGVNWVVSASSIYNNNPDYSGYAAFNKFTGTSAGWFTPTGLYNTTTGAYTGSVSTTILGGVGAQTGEWLQIQSSVPIVLQSYTFSVSDTPNRIAKVFYIVGSMDGSSWYPLQYASMATNPFTVINSTATNYLTVNTTGTQTLTAGASATVTTISYSTSTTPYIYFRIIINSIFTSNDGLTQIGEWYVNFARAPTQALSMNHTGQYQLVSTGPASGSVMPNQTGLSTNTWTQSGVNWAANASTTFTGYSIYALYNNTPAGAWLSAGSVYNTSTGVYSGSISTTIQSIGSPVFGEWVQIQASVPLVLQSYTYADGGAVANIPKTYYIVGSNDGSTWVPLQFVTMTTNPFTTSTYTTASTYITLNTTGAITIQGNVTGQGTSTAYTFSTQPYMYFRMVITSLWASNAGYCEFTEWLINFRNSVSYSSNYGSTWLNTSSTVSNESVALSPSGQYALSTNSVSPFARLTLDNTNVDAQGVLAPTTGAGTVTYSSSIVKVGTHSAFFDNTAGAVPSVYLNYTVPAVLNRPSMLTMACWMYPMAYGLTVYPFGFYDSTNTVIFSLYSRSAETGLQINTSTGISYIATGIPIPLNTWSHITAIFLAGVATLYMNGVLITTVPAGTPGPILAGSGSITNFLIGSRHTGDAFRGYFDDVRIYTSALNADEVNGLFKNPALTQTIAVSNSYLPITSYTEPVLPGITANVVDTAVSQTGQYMVAVTSSTTNNVYYSTDYGVTFTALTIGTTAMVSCSISYDGSYLTVTNATTTYTLNKNTRGFTLAIGNQAGRINQGLNAIAIGDKAGQTNQSNNSIVLNATGVALDAVAPGFYVAPIATAGSSVSGSFAVLGYGTDTQVVQTGMSIRADGFVGIGTNNPAQLLDITNVASLTPAIRLQNTFSAGYVSMGSVLGVNSYIGLQATNTTTSALGTPTLVVANNGNVGIGTVNPINKLHVHGGIITASGFTDITKPERTIIMYYSNSDDAGVVESYNYTVGTRYPVLINPNGGNVGIGTVSPTNILSIYGTNPTITTQCNNFYQTTRILLQAYDTNRFSYLSQEETGSFTQILRLGVTNTYGAGIGKQINLETDGTARLVVNQAGTVLLPAYINGTLSIINGTGQVSSSSDRRVKEDIVYITDTQTALSHVNNLKPATFKFKDGEGTQLGFIAQDVEQFIPLAVDGKKYEWQWEEEDGKPKFDENGDIVYKVDENGNKIVRPRGLTDRAIIATQTLAIQELAKQATSQATLVQELAKQATSQSEIVQELTKKETSQSEIVQELAKKLTTAEQQLAAKSAALDALIAWAQTQGYSVTA